MAESVLVRLFEHNNWANLQIIQACSALSEEQLDAEPQTVTKGSIRQTLWHIMEAQEGYRSQLIGKEHRVNWDSPSAFAELQQGASFSGDGLLDLARGEDSKASSIRMGTPSSLGLSWFRPLTMRLNTASRSRACSVLWA
jgi:uncharacterized damage-inducible protein DinB